MIFKWLKKLFGLYDSSPTEILSNGELKPSAPKSLCDEFDKRKERVKQNRDKLKQSSTDWYVLNIPPQKDELQTRVFSPHKFENIPSLQALKDERLRKEAYELKVREEKAKLLLDKLEILIAQRKCQEAKQIMDEITHEIVRTKDSIIIKQYANIQKSLSELEKELEHERFVKLAEEQKRKEEEERKKREREEKEKVENEYGDSRKQIDLRKKPKKKNKPNKRKGKDWNRCLLNAKKIGLHSSKYWKTMVSAICIILQIEGIFHPLNGMEGCCLGVIVKSIKSTYRIPEAEI